LSVKKRPGDLSPFLVPPPDSPYEFLQGVLTAIDAVAGTNTVELAGALTQTNLVVIGNPADLAPGDAVLVLRLRTRYFIVGPLWNGSGSTNGPSQRRVGTMTPRTSTPALVTTTETVQDTVTADLVAGRTYKITYKSGIISSVAADSAFLRIREDNLAGNQLQLERVYSPLTGGGGSRWTADLEAEFTAVSTGTKTFVGTLIRATGTGNITSPAGAQQPTYFYVDYVRTP
jgi:hypothetical protein